MLFEHSADHGLDYLNQQILLSMITEEQSQLVGEVTSTQKVHPDEVSMIQSELSFMETAEHTFLWSDDESAALQKVLSFQREHGD